VSPRRAIVILTLPLLLGGCGSARRAQPPLPPALAAAMRPIGIGPRFQPRAPARPVPACRRGLGARVGAHLELFARDRVVLVPAGIGVGRPLRIQRGRVTAARCHGAAVTLDPTGVVLVRPGSRATVGSLFAQWRVPLAARRLAGFSTRRGGVRAYVNGRRYDGDPRTIRLARHAEIVLELGPYVPPHRSYAFPAGL
jgi:hypothetical protein